MNEFYSLHAKEIRKRILQKNIIQKWVLERTDF